MKTAKQTKKPVLLTWGSLLLASTALGGIASSAHAQQSEEIIVTATKRTENLQDVPLAIQAITGERLDQLNISDFAGYAQHLPTLSYSPTYGPGYDRPFMRGVASGENGNHSGSMPSVGTYLDEQPITTIVGNLDLHLYDIARVEVLAGPQGTLYGASSQAGTVRVITNRPDPSEFSAAYDLEVNNTQDGGWGQVAEGYVNAPLSRRAALRAVGWAEHDDGYIDNVFGTRNYSYISDDNADRVEEDYNTVDTYGARIALGIDLNDSWTATPQVMAQYQETSGVFAEQRTIGSRQVTHFLPEWNEDSWVQGALTIEGAISNFEVVFAASALSRDIDSQQDYADYGYFYDTLFGYGCYFVDNAGAGSFCDVLTVGALQGDPIVPAQNVEGRDHHDRETYEIRVASPAENRLRAIVGAFYQRSEHRIHQRYYFDDDFRDAYEVTGNPDTIWLTEQLRTDEETALFGELSFDFTENLTGTVGVRSFQTENSLRGFFGFGAGFSGTTGEAACFGPPSLANEPCTNLDKSTEEDGELYRVNLEWNLDDDRMIYATYSEGFRPGGINRRGTLEPYSADFLDNYEMGWKTDWANGRLRWNGAIFHEVWEDFQFAFLGMSGLTEIQNAGDAEINGIETDIGWMPVDSLTINAAATWLDTELTNAAIVDTVEGTPLPVAPDFKFDLTARYEFPFRAWQAFVQGNVSYVGDRSIDIRQTEAALIGELDAYWLANASLGVDGDGYRVTLFIDNLFDDDGETGRYTECAIATCFGEPYDVIVRPRTIGVRFGQRF